MNQLEIDRQQDLEEMIMTIALHDFDNINKVFIKPEWFENRLFKIIVSKLQDTSIKIDGLMDLYARTQAEIKDVTFTYDDLLNLKAKYSTAENLSYLSKELHRSNLRKTLNELKQEHNFFPTVELEQTMFDILAEMNKIGTSRDEGNLKEAFDLFEYRLENDAPQGIKTFSQMDSALGGGIQAGMLITIGARPAVGKSAFAINLIQKCLERNKGMRVDLFSLEMPKREILARFLSLNTRIPSYYFKNLNRLLTPVDKELVRNAIEYYRQEDIQVFDKVSDINRILAIIKERASTAKENGYIAVIDYVGLIKVANSKKDRRLQIEEITRELKVLANEYQIPIIILSQLSRGVESRQDKSPQLSDLRESGSIEQDSNVVGFLTNVETEENNEGYQRIEFQIRKNRDGELMDLKFKFFKNRMFFQEVFE